MIVFSVSGPITGNSQQRDLRDPDYTAFMFRCLLNMFFFSEYQSIRSCSVVLEALHQLTQAEN